MNNSFTKKLNIYRFFDDFILIYPLYALMFEDSGVSVSNISILFLVWSATSFLLEVPSGVLADKYDRKAILIIAQTVRILGYLSWLFIPNFWGFLFGFVCWGIKSALTSGTREALLYDGLEEMDAAEYYAKELGIMKTTGLIAVLAASGLASLVYPFGYPVILILSIFALVLSNIALLTIKSTNPEKSTEEKEYFKILSKGIKNVIQDYKLFLIVLVGAFFIGIMAIDEYFSLFIAEKGIQTVQVGTAFAIYTLLQSGGSLIAHKFEKYKISLNIFLIILGILFILLPILPGLNSLICFIGIAFISGIAQIVSSSRLQAQLKGNIRATVGSVVGFIAEIFAFSIYISMSILSEYFNLTDSFRYLSYGVLIIITTFVIINLYSKTRGSI